MHTATYSPEDNKIRIYPANRLDDELGDEGYKEFKSAGYKWAAKQECFVCPRWTPAAEDWALDLCGEIGDEDYSCEERSADRAERFGGYREKRRDEAHGHADDAEAGPAVFAHHNQRRAERQAARHDRHRRHALSQWSKAEYWQARTEGVIRHALYRSSAPVRRSRLLRLEAEQRKQQKSIDESKARYAAWKKVAAEQDAEKAQRWAHALANTSGCWGDYQHPRQPGLKPASLWCLLTADRTNGDPITGHEAAALWLADRGEPGAEGSYAWRWAKHYELRTTYEKAMLENEGGMCAEAEIEPGGWIRSPRQPRYCTESAPGGWVQVVSVHRSPATKRVTSVKVWGSKECYNDKTNQRERKPALVTCNVERMPENAYRAPTDEEREAFKAAQAKHKAERKATTPKAPSLINPTDNDAERLQVIWNAEAKRRREARDDFYIIRDFEPSEVLRMTQAQYSKFSKGSYANFETRTLHACGKIARRSSNLWTREGENYDKTLGAALCKLRIAPAAGSNFSSPRRVIVITDKPQKPLPIDWEKLLPAEEPAAVESQREAG